MRETRGEVWVVYYCVCLVSGLAGSRLTHPEILFTLIISSQPATFSRCTQRSEMALPRKTACLWDSDPKPTTILLGSPSPKNNNNNKQRQQKTSAGYCTIPHPGIVEIVDNIYVRIVPDIGGKRWTVWMLNVRAVHTKKSEWVSYGGKRLCAAPVQAPGAQDCLLTRESTLTPNIAKLHILDRRVLKLLLKVRSHISHSKLYYNNSNSSLRFQLDWIYHIKVMACLCCSTLTPWLSPRPREIIFNQPWALPCKLKRHAVQSMSFPQTFWWPLHRAIIISFLVNFFQQTLKSVKDLG